MIKGWKIKIKNQNIEGQNLEYWIEMQNWKFLRPQLQKKNSKKKKRGFNLEK